MRRIVAYGLALAVAVALAGAWNAEPGAPSAAAAAPQPLVDSANRAQQLAAQREQLLTAADEAAEVLSSSKGKVLDESSRTELGEAIEQAELEIGELEHQLFWGAAPPVSVPAASAVAASTESAPEASTASTSLASSPLVARLGDEMERVRDAVADWKAEQKRIAAERAAALAAANAGARGASGGMFVEHIWTSGGQAQIDACRGSVNVAGIAGYLGAQFYAAEHWSCGGSAWTALGTGARVSVPGYGTYEVVGRVNGLAYGADASAVPAGYDGYYQTCINGSGSNMSVWLLNRVG